MAALLNDLPVELFMRIVRFTPHPCAAILREYTFADEWRELVESRNVFRWELNYYKGELAEVRLVRKLCQIPWTR